MDLQGADGPIAIDVNRQSDTQLRTALAELSDEANRRGLELVTAAGATAVREGQTVPRTEPTPEERYVFGLMREELGTQLAPAHEGYVQMVNALNRQSENAPIAVLDQDHLAEDFQAWLTDDKLGYIKSILEREPNLLSFTLVATPNVQVGAGILKRISLEFNTVHPPRISPSDALIQKYDADQLSGTTPEDGRAVHFCLIPRLPTYDSPIGSTEQQLESLRDLQAANPAVGLKVPSLLDALTYWHTLLAYGESLVISGKPDFKRLTSIRHFDLPPQALSGSSPSVLISELQEAGIPRISAISSNATLPAIIAIG